MWCTAFTLCWYMGKSCWTAVAPSFCPEVYLGGRGGVSDHKTQKIQLPRHNEIHTGHLNKSSANNRGGARMSVDHRVRLQFWSTTIRGKVFLFTLEKVSRQMQGYDEIRNTTVWVYLWKWPLVIGPVEINLASGQQYSQLLQDLTEGKLVNHSFIHSSAVSVSAVMLSWSVH